MEMTLEKIREMWEIGGAFTYSFSLMIFFFFFFFCYFPNYFKAEAQILPKHVILFLALLTGFRE